MWAATTSALVRLVGSTWKRIGKESGYEAKFARVLLVTRDGTLWVATEDTIVFLRHGEKVFRQTGEHVSRVGALAEAPDGTVWVTMTPDIARPVIVQGEKSREPGPVIRAGMGILFDRAGSLWATTDFNGVLRVRFPERLKTDTFDPSSPGIESFNKQEGLANAAMRPAFEGFQLMEDREGDIWVGRETGLDRFRPTNVIPVTLPAGTMISALSGGDQGSDWTGFLWGPGGKSLIHTPEWSVLPYRLDVPVISSYRKDDGTVWLGLGEGRGLLRFKDGQFSQIPLPPGIKKGFDIQAMTEDHSGNLWISIIQNGVFERTNGVWVPFGNLPGLPRGVPLVLMTDASGRVWYGYQQNTGVAVFDGKTVRTFSSKDGLQVIHVESMYQRERHIWIAGERGLAFFDGSRFRMLISDGPPFGGITGVVETASGDLWLNALQGVIHVPAREVREAIAKADYRARCEIFDSMDGLQGWVSQPRPQPSVVETTDGRLWFLTSGGLFQIDPTHISRNALPPPVYIEQIKADGKAYNPTQGLRLPALVRDVSIDYTALSLAAPEKVHFRYKLEGQDGDWREIVNERQVQYSNLPPRHYRFLVIASNNSGVWNEAGASLDFSIAAVYYQTRWFQALGVAALVAVLAVFYQLRLRYVGRQFNIRMEERINERTRIARDLHDTLLQSLAGVSLQLGGIAKRVASSPELAVAQLDSVREQVECCFREARQKVWHLRSPALEDQGLPAALRDFLDQTRPASRVPCNFAVIGRVHPYRLDVEEHLMRIAQESVNNALRHAHASQVQLGIAYDSGGLRLSISDDGQGFDLETACSKTGHWGLRNMRERAEEIGAQWRIHTGKGLGTMIEIYVPASCKRENACE